MILQACRHLEVGSFVIALSLGVALTGLRPAAASDGTHQGTVKDIIGSKLVLKMGVEEREMAFNIDPGTRITINGRPATVTDLKRGDAARVTAKKVDGGGLQAMKVAAKRNKMPSPPVG